MLSSPSSRAARALAAGCASSSRSICHPTASSSRLPGIRAASTASGKNSNRSAVLQNKFGITKEAHNSYRRSEQPQPQLQDTESGRNVEDSRQIRRFKPTESQKRQPLEDRGVWDASTSSSSLNWEAMEAAAEPELKPSLPDPLAPVQDQLRAYFARRVEAKSPSGSAVESISGNVDSLADHQSDFDFVAYVDSKAKEDQVTPSFSAESYSLPSDSSSQTTGKLSRPTLADLKKADSDQFAGLYQSETAWNPNKDYALMQDGPVRESQLQITLESGSRRYVVVILDGDNLIFDPRHMNQGYDGGKFVANELRERIARKHQLVPHMLDLRIRIFSSINALTTVLAYHRVTRRESFFDFMQGILDSNMHNYVVNVGRAKQAADRRVKAALADAIHDPRCFRAYLGGLDDFGYKEDLNAIQELGLLESKVNLVQVPGYAVSSNKYREYAHRALDLDYLFKNYGKVMEESEQYVSSHSTASSYLHDAAKGECQDSQQDAESLALDDLCSWRMLSVPDHGCSDR